MSTQDQSHKNSELLFSEAPASWNTRYVDPNGFECQLTLRAEKGLALLEKVNNAINYLLNNNCTPYTYYRGGKRTSTGKNHQKTNGNHNKSNQENPAWCPIHQCEMKRWDKNGKVWYSHKIDGEWCKGN